MMLSHDRFTTQYDNDRLTSDIAKYDNDRLISDSAIW